MTRTPLALAALLALLPLAAAAQTPPPAPEKPRPPRPGVRVPGPRPQNPALALTWFGQAAFVVSTPTGAKVLIDPFAAEIGLPLPAEKLEVDAVALTHEHADHTNVAGFVSGSPLVLRGLAGDGWAKIRENVKGVRISTIPAFHDAEEGKQRGKNAIFVLEVAGFRIAHLGDFGQARLTPEQKEALGPIDVVLVPVGGHYTIGPEEAAALVKDLAPRRAAIPMHYRVPGLKIEELGPVEPFLAAFPPERIRKVDENGVRFLPAAKNPPAFDVIVLRPGPEATVAPAGPGGRKPAK